MTVSVRFVVSLLVIVWGVVTSPASHASDVSSLGAVRSVLAAIDTTAQPVSLDALRGVVWRPPTRVRPARRELRAMHDRGVEAIRLTQPISDPAVLSRADALGLALFVDLPLPPLSAKALRDSSDALRREAEAVIRLARAHPSIRALGLTSLADTSVPSACQMLADLHAFVRETGPERLRTYYVTPFRPESDRCRDAVDWVLLDLRDEDDPVSSWTQWQTNGVDAVGVGALGWWIDDGAARGLRVPHSPEAQARTLETALRSFLEIPEPPPVFVYRWRDADGLSTRRYGLYRRDGESTPALDVVTGLYTGEQTVFAFPSGEAPPLPIPWRVLTVWGLVILVGLVQVQVPLFRRTLSRYFTGHGFYLDAVKEGRETSLELAVLVLTVSSAAMGVVGTSVVQSLTATPALAAVLDALPPSVQQLLGDVMQVPALVGVGVGIGFGVVTALWASGLVLLSRQWTSLRFKQGLTLVVWPTWPLLVLMLVVVVLPTQPSTGGVALAGSVGLIAYGMVRTLRDYAVVARVPVVLAAGAALFSPVVLGLVSATVFAAQNHVSLVFLWHLLTRT